MNSITGTIINYYLHCQTQCWLFANRLNLEDNSEDVRVGRILHELNEEKSKKSEIAIDNIKIDKLTKEYLVELKKSDSDIEAVTWQVLLYLKVLKNRGVEKKGKIEFVQTKTQPKKTRIVELTKEKEEELNEVLANIDKLIQNPTPPPPILNKKCKKCAYYEYCFV